MPAVSAATAARANRSGPPDVLRQRIITALVAGALLLAVLFVVPEALARGVIVGVILIAGWEWSGFVASQGAGGRVAYVVVLGALLAAAWWLLGRGDISATGVFGIAGRAAKIIILPG